MCGTDSEQVPFTANFRCFGNLPKLLKRRYRRASIEYRFKAHPGVKDAIETMGIPHTEVDVVLANGRSVDFRYQLQPLDTIDVYPVHCAVPAETVLHLCVSPVKPVTFVIDLHLGKLARRLRQLGFDCLYQNDFSDAEIMHLSFDQQRIILTRDRGILRHRQVVHGYLVRSDQVDKQLREVVGRYQLFDQIRAWRRCLACNGLLEIVEKAAILDRLQPLTRRYYHDFRRCRDCNRLYWQGSHFEKINRWLETLHRSES
jgi:uncharacterized protein with PIN domain